MAIWDSPDQPPRGWLKPAYKYIKDKLGNDLVGVEIGIAQGYGTEYVLDGLSLKKFYMVDPYVPYEFNDTSVEDFDKMYHETNNKFAMYGNAVLMRITSEEAAKQFEDGSLDFVYIDGNHLYPAVKKDIDIWWPKVRAGGVMGGHDYDIVSSSHNIDTYLYTFRVNGIHYGVVKAVNDFADKHMLSINAEAATHNNAYDWWVHKDATKQ